MKDREIPIETDKPERVPYKTIIATVLLSSIVEILVVIFGAGKFAGTTNAAVDSLTQKVNGLSDTFEKFKKEFVSRDEFLREQDLQNQRIQTDESDIRKTRDQIEGLQLRAERFPR